MGVPFEAGDQKRIVDFLGLDRCQLISSSTVKYLMDDAERFDTSYQTDVVTEIREILLEVDGTGGLEEQRASASAIISQSSSGEYSWTTAKTDLSIVESSLKGARVRLLKLLDPSRTLSEAYGKRVIRT